MDNDQIIRNDGVPVLPLNFCSRSSFCGGSTECGIKGKTSPICQESMFLRTCKQEGGQVLQVGMRFYCHARWHCENMCCVNNVLSLSLKKKKRVHDNKQGWLIKHLDPNIL